MRPSTEDPSGFACLTSTTFCVSKLALRINTAAQMVFLLLIWPWSATGAFQWQRHLQGCMELL